MSESAEVSITTVNCLLIITCIVGNCFVCAVVMRNRDMRIAINYLLVNLALADIAYAMFSIPQIILSFSIGHPEGVPGTVLCTILTTGNLAWIAAAASVFTLVAIAIERYYTVVHPYGSNGNLMTIRKLKVIISASWICALLLRFLSFLKRKFVKEINPNSCIYAWPEGWMPMMKAYFVMKRSYVFLSIVLLVGLYSRVVYTLWLKRNSDNVLTHRQQGVLKVRKRVTLMVVTVSTIFVITWGTHEILHILDKYGFFKLSRFALPISHTLIMLNSAVNPFAYALISQRFREKMKGMICCRSRAFVTRIRDARARDPEPHGIEMAENTE